jgi:hypothetical protein
MHPGAAPPKIKYCIDPASGLRPACLAALDGTAEAVPFPNLREPKLFRSL